MFYFTCDRSFIMVGDRDPVLKDDGNTLHDELYHSFTTFLQ